ncbi:MAG: hypothetical protein WCP12_06215 [bacterium]
MKIFIYPLLASFIILFTGCRWNSGMDEPYFKVEKSGLNWVEIRQYETTGSKQRIRLRIDGNGMVTVRDGTSALVGNSFAANNKNENWEDIREKRITLSEDDVALIFQSLVNAGMFVKPEEIPFMTETSILSTNETALVYVSANINNKTVGSSAPIAKPDLLEQLKLVVLTFYQPQPIRKQRQPTF